MLKLFACLILPAAALAGASSGEAFEPTFESRVELTPQKSKIDTLVFTKLKQLGIQPANLSSDAVFLRRAYLDTIGTLPIPQEATEFLKDPDPQKRAKLIDQLLERPEFADYWTNKWCDLLRVKAEFPINLWPNAAQAYHHWILASIRENKPYDRFVREMLTESGSNFRTAPVNFYRALQSKEPKAIAQTVALTFMGARAEKWPEPRLADMSTFFTNIGYKETGEWKEEIIFFDAAKTALPRPATFPDGTTARLTPDRDPRDVFAAWLINPKNRAFNGNIVNRIWTWLLGRGIVHEPDDMRADNPPSNPELLALLEQELVASKYDLKHIYRLILNSETYQLSSIPRTQSAEADKYFAYYPLRRLDAEVLIDALCQITGTNERYSSAIPEPYTFIPDNQRSIGLPDGSISSSFLEQFGRPPRDTGLESERNNRLTPSQALHMLNSSQVQQKLQRINGVKTWQGLYLLILSRFPTEAELKIVNTYPNRGDVAWALINSAEFLYRH